MTPGHIIFIPGAIMIGMFIGFLFGMRAARNQFDLQQKRTAEREAARAERAARRAAQVDKPAAQADKSAG
jgi:hypothetical protein